MVRVDYWILVFFLFGDFFFLGIRFFLLASDGFGVSMFSSFTLRCFFFFPFLIFVRQEFPFSYLFYSLFFCLRKG
jgi:hypothetical protein